MTRFVSPARSAIDRPGAEMNSEIQPVAYTRTAGLWVVLAASAVMLLPLILILQNGQPSEVHFLGTVTRPDSAGPASG